MTENFSVFISYSWSNTNHEEWVINFAERLMANGVNVVLDKWDLKEGHDKYTFMEKMVSSKEIHKVLLILDKKYAEKAEERSGGVGTETQIISPEIYLNVSQEKFIPIVVERDEDGKEYLPTFLKSRIYIDLSSPDKFEANYEKLIRNIFQRPANVKPQLGKPPLNIFEDAKNSYRTNLIAKSIEYQIEKTPTKVNSIAKDFFDEYFECLKQFSIVFHNRNDINIIGKVVIDNLNSYSILRNDFITFLKKITKAEVDFDIDILLRFFEQIQMLKWPLDEKMNNYNYEFDNFKFIIHELFLYSIAICLKNENYKTIEELLHSSYFITSKSEIYAGPKKFNYFYNHIQIFDSYYKESYSKNVYSPMADFILKRIPDELNKEILIEADLLCFYIGSLNGLKWFPLTYVYKTRGQFNFFDRMISKRHFEKVKTIFNVTTIDEFRELLKKAKADEQGNYTTRYSNFSDPVLPIFEIIDIEKIGSLR